MMISDLSVRRPVLAVVANILVVVFGFVAFQLLPLRQYPDVDVPVISVETNYPGASAEIVENRITRIIEDRITGIEGIRSISSESRDGRSAITIEFLVDRDIDKAASDVRDRVARVLKDLPVEADPPEISKADSDQRPVLWLNVASSALDGLALTDWVERNLVDRFSVIDGVARVRVSGAKVYAMRIWLDTDALAARQMTVADVERALRAQNVELPGGRIESRDMQFVVRLLKNFETEQEFGAMIIGRQPDGSLVRIRDIARVELGAKEERTEYRGNTVSMVGMGIVRQSKSNTLDVARAVKEEAEKVRKALPDYITLHDSYDSSLFIEDSIREVYETLGTAILLVVAVLWLFLGSPRAATVPAATVPVSLIGAYLILYALGFSINLLTLLALVLAIGLVVDDSIVVLENIHRRIEEGEPPLLAAFRGARQVGFAVIATTAVLVAVFLPITFLSGNAGRLFTEFAWAMAAAVMFSSFTALTLSPVLCAWLIRPHHPEKKPSLLQRMIEAPQEWLNRVYARTLHPFLRASWLMVPFMVLVLFGIQSFLNRLPEEFAPAQDSGVIFMRILAPEGSSFAYVQKHLRQIEEILMPYVENKEVKRLLVRAPGGFDVTLAANDGRGILVMEPWFHRSRSSFEILAEIRQKMKAIPGVQVFANIPQRLSGGSGDPVEFVLGGPSYRLLGEWQQILLKKAEEFGGFVDLDTDFKETRPQMLVRILTERAGILGVSVETIGRTLETVLGSRRVTTFTDGGEEYDVVLEGRKGGFHNLEDVMNLRVRSDSTGELVPLADLIEVAEQSGAPVLRRFNRVRAVTLTAGLKPGYSLSEALTFLEKVTREELPDAAVVDYKGESREFMDSKSAGNWVFVLALLIVYLVLAAQFESFLTPLVILLAVPLAVFGAFGGLLIHAQTLNMFSWIGMIMLIGLAAKNGILIVEFSNQLRDEGIPFEEAIERAAQSRFRPILMTAITTMAGAIPLILATNAGSELRVVIGVVVLYGVGAATFFTLYVIPMAYRLLARRASTPRQNENRLEELIKSLGE